MKNIIIIILLFCLVANVFADKPNIVLRAKDLIMFFKFKTEYFKSIFVDKQPFCIKSKIKDVIEIFNTTYVFLVSDPNMGLSILCMFDTDEFHKAEKITLFKKTFFIKGIYYGMDYYNHIIISQCSFIHKI